MNRCEAPNCKMRTYALTEEQLKMMQNDYVISFHKFPDDPEKRQSWITAANKPSWKPPILNSSLCSLHFRDDCFNEKNELIEDAVPSIFFDDFRHHMKEIVEKLDIRYKDDNSKAGKPEDGKNTSVESNQIDPKSDEEFGVVECEEVVIYEDSEDFKFGIENISIPESDEITDGATKADDQREPVPIQIDSNNVADIKISDFNISTLNADNSEKTVHTKLVDEAKSHPTASNAVPSRSLPERISVNLTKPQLINPSSNVAKPPVTSASVGSHFQRSSNVLNTSTKSIWDFKSTTLTSSQRLSVSSSSNAAKPLLSSSSTASADESIATQASGTSFNRPIIVDSALFTPSNKSSEPSKPANPTPPISIPSKSTTTSNLPESNSSISRGKSTPSESNSILEPTAKSLVVQLLNIVKMANTSDANKPKPGQTFSSYLVTSKSTETFPGQPYEIMSSAEVIDNIANYVRMIKNESFVEPNNVSIICGSPAIFLLKNVIVEECDPTMNCVYVITTEHLVSHLCNMKSKSNPGTNSNRQQQPPAEVPKTNAANQRIKPLLVADLVSSANPKTVVSIQKQIEELHYGLTKDNKMTTKPNTISGSSNVGEKLANNSISSCGTTTTKTSAHTAKPTASNSISSASQLVTPTSNSVSRSTPTAKKTISVTCTVVPKVPSSNSVPCSTPAKPKTNSVSLKPPTNSSNLCSTPTKPLTNFVRQPVNCSNSVSTVAEQQTNSVSSTTAPRPPANNSILKSTLAKSIMNSATQLANYSNSLPTPAKQLPNSVSFTAVPKSASNNSNSFSTPAKPVMVSSTSVPKHSVNNPVHSAPTKPAVNNLTKSSTNTSSAHFASTQPTTNGVSSTSYQNLHQKALASFLNKTNSPKIPKSTIGHSITKPASSVTSTAPAFTIDHSITKPASSVTCTAPTFTIDHSITKPASSVTSTAKTPSPLSDTPVARVIPTTICATVVSKSPASNSLATQTAVLKCATNIFQTPQLPLHFATPTLTTTPIKLVYGPPILTLMNQHAIAPAPPVPVLTPSSVNSSNVRPSQSTPITTLLTKPYTVPISSSIPSQPQPSTYSSAAADYIFKPIELTSFDTNLKTPELLITYDSIEATKPSTSAAAIQATVKSPLKRKWTEINDDDDEKDDDDDPFFATCGNDEDYNQQYIDQQKNEIKKCESNILQKEREISNLKKRIQALKKRLNACRNPNDTKTDEQLVEEILLKYLDSDGVQFFIGQMKVAGKTYTQFRWSEDDKLFALGLLYRNPVEYNTLFQKYTLPSDKTLTKFVNRVKKTESQDNKT